MRSRSSFARAQPPPADTTSPPIAVPATVPHLPTGFLRRDRLGDALARGVNGPVTLVSAGAGSGKTLLVASWLRDGGWGGPVAWVSVDRDERDATHFLTAVVESLRSSASEETAAALEALSPAPGGSHDELIGRLAEGLRDLVPILLVLDDLSELRSQSARDALAALLACALPQLRVVLLARSDPQLQLHRPRLAGQLCEIRSPDLAFTLEETGELMSGLGLDLADDAVNRLCEKTEGWAAGLRLAAMSLAGAADPVRFIDEFSGSERTVADYLLEEVLAGQPPAVRHLLLRTSVLEHVNGPLANLLTGTSEAERLLQDLDDANALVMATDVSRSWFRYHHLLLDVLRRELRREAPDEVQELHGRASRWYGEHGFAVEAIRHAQEADDWDQASDLLMEHWFSLFLDGQQKTIHGLLAAAPAALVRSDAELATLVAADRLAAGRPDDADAHLAVAERLAATVRAPRRRRFEVVLALVRLNRARTRGDFNGAIDVARAILIPEAGDSRADVTSNEDIRALALMHLGFAEVWAVQLDGAERHLRDGLALAYRIGRPYIAIGCLAPLAQLANMTQRLDVAEACGREAIKLAERLGWSDEPIVGSAYTELGGALLGRGRMEESELWLDRAERVLHGRPDPEASVMLPMHYGVLRFAQRRYEAALACFRDAELAVEHLRLEHDLATTLRTWLLRVVIRLGDVAAARSALAAAGESARRVTDWCIVAAHLHLAEGHPQRAVDAVRPVVNGSATVEYTVMEVEALLLEAIARDRLGQPEAAGQALERALDRAERWGQVWIILSQPDVRGVLERHPRHRTSHGAFIAQLLDHFEGDRSSISGLPPDGVRLSERELRVLGFLPTNLSAKEIASELVLSVHTVKTHMRGLYRKLGVHRRADAVERARKLGMLMPARRRP